MDRLGAPGFCNKGWEVYNVRELGSAQTPPPIFFTPQPELTHRRVARNQTRHRLPRTLCFISILSQLKESRDFPADSVAKTPCSQCRGPGFDPWSGNQIPRATANTQCSQRNAFLKVNICLYLFFFFASTYAFSSHSLLILIYIRKCLVCWLIMKNNT